MNVSIARGIVKLSELPEGSLFLYRNAVALKSEYRTDAGACKCFIVGSGEMFWGGTNTAKELNELYVTPVLLSNN